jgi:hypothetical protein
MAREREDGHVYFVGGLVAFPGIPPSRLLAILIAPLAPIH